MKKKFISYLLVIVLLIGVIMTLSGCGDEEEKTSKKKVNNTENNTISSVDPDDDNAQEITSELPEGSSLFVTNLTDNGDSYTLEGVLYDEYIVTEVELKNALKDGYIEIEDEKCTIKKEDDDDIEMYELCIDDDAHYSIRKHEDGKYHLIRLAQISTCQRKTTKIRKITVSKSLKCENLYTEEEESLEETFKDFYKQDAPDTTHPTPSYTFEFKNGKCTKLFVDTGL